MRLPINQDIKPLYAALLRLGFPKYLITESFDHLMIELKLDDLWNECEKFVRDQSHVAVLIPGYTGDAEDALGIFLTKLLEKGGREFIDNLERIITDFNKWNEEIIDYSDVQQKLLNLGFSEDELSKIFTGIGKIESKQERPTKLFSLDVFSAKGQKVDPSLCFVLMPFDIRYDGIYTEIEKVVKHKRFDCQRADKIYSNHPIIKDIVDNITKANFIIADLTGRNPNVMYELGIAHQLQKETILISQNVVDIPFDLKHLRTFIYQDSFVGIEPFKDGLTKCINYLIDKKKIQYEKHK